MDDRYYKKSLIQIHFTQQAEDDLAEVLLYIARDNVDAAYHVRDAILDACDLILENPKLAVIMPGVTKGIHKAVVQQFTNYIIFYKEVEDGIKVIRLGNGRRDWERYL